MGIKTEPDFEDFTQNILDLQNITHQKAYNAIREILFGNKTVKSNATSINGNRKEIAKNESSVQKKNIPEQASNSKNKNFGKYY